MLRLQLSRNLGVILVSGVEAIGLKACNALVSNLWTNVMLCGVCGCEASVWHSEACITCSRYRSIMVPAATKAYGCSALIREIRATWIIPSYSTSPLERIW